MKSVKKEMSFEEEMARLEEIVGLLEKGDAPLDESMKLFEEGIRLTGMCDKKLTKAEQTIERLAGGKDVPCAEKNENDAAECRKGGLLE